MKQKNINILLLSIAILSLSFTAFQSRISETNDTTRQASFEMLKTLNHLQYLVDKEYYASHNKERYLDGWSDIMLINDLAIFITPLVDKDAQMLLKTWQNNFEKLDEKQVNKKLSKLIEQTRKDLKQSINEL